MRAAPVVTTFVAGLGRVFGRVCGYVPAIVVSGALAIIVAGPLAGCAKEGEDSARGQYNQALADYEAGRWEKAAEGFLAARDRAGLDPDLRFRAAFNLGLAHARQADAATSGEAPGQPGAPAGAEGAEDAPRTGPEAALAALRQSAAWFRDAVRLDPEDKDARVNLEVVLRRIQILADELNKGENSLEARLERVIEDQRSLRDQIRALMQRVAESGAEAEPVAFQDDFDGLATFERRLLADVGTVSDLAGEELGLLQGKEQREQEEEVRVVQLQNLDMYLQAARGDLADTRRLLRRLSGDRAHRRSDGALAALKRAREQLLDPIAVLKGIAQDQVQVLGHTVGLEQLGKADIQVGQPGQGEQAGHGEQGSAPDGSARAAVAPAGPPPWLTAEHLRERQEVLQQRTDEVLARLRAGVEGAQNPEAAGDPNAQSSQSPGATPGAPQDPRQQRVLAQAADAIPLLEQAVSHMQGAATSLSTNSATNSATAAPDAALRAAAEQQTRALEALFAAIERFSDIRGLIELAYRDHAATSALLAPADAPEAAALPPEIASLPAAERTERILALVRQNRDRMTRLDGLFSDELAALDAQAAQAAQAGAPDPAAAQGQVPPEQIEAARQQYVAAQGLRVQAEQALGRIEAAMSQAGRIDASVNVEAARAASAEAMQHIEELRRLFFSIVEHLKELLQNQISTHDQTGSAAAGPDEELASRLGALVEPQTGHAAMSQALAQALAEQADAAAQAPQQAGAAAGGADTAQRMGEAAQEVTQATTQMQGAADFLRKDAEAAQASSVDVAPTMQAQQLAIEHLENALRLLEPPKEQQQDQQEQEQQEQEQQQQQQQQQQQAQEMSQQQAQRRLQEIRDREAERRREQPQFKPEPVEKDW